MSDLEERLLTAFGRRFTPEEIAKMPLPAEAALGLVDLLEAGARTSFERNAPAAYFRVAPEGD
jgi:hypothetical protein